MRPVLSRRQPLLAAVLGAALLVVAGRAAWAEPVRLRTGATLEVTSIALEGEAFVLGLEIGAGKGTMKLPLAQVEPADLVRLLRPRTAPGDARGQVRLAHAALAAGLHVEAVERAAAAAQLDPLWAPEQERVVDAVRAAEAGDALREAELDLRLARPTAARTRLRLLLEDGVPVVPPDLEAQRARLLLRLAEAALKTSLAALGPVPPTPPAPGAGAAAPAPAPVDPAAAAALADAEAQRARAEQARERAADPALAAPKRERLLLDAATHLLHARRTLLALPATASADLGARLEGLRGLLVATWLDLADLARGACAWAAALDRVQAALVLEPESERAWELRRWIEADLHAPLVLPPEPPLLLDVGFGSPFARWGWPAPYPTVFGSRPPAGPYAGGYGHREGHGNGGGAVHHPGTRR